MMHNKDTQFYKGLSAYYLLCFKPALQYTVFEQVKAAWLQSKNAKHGSKSQQQLSLSAAEAFLLGMVARTIATVVVFPFLRAKVVMQTRKTTTRESTTTAEDADGTTTTDDATTDNGNSNGSTSKKDSVLTLLLEIWKSKGVAGLYQGLGPELTRGIFSAALMLMIKEKIAVAVRARLR
jgi:adenine nucleotide transporter 17